MGEDFEDIADEFVYSPSSKIQVNEDSSSTGSSDVSAPGRVHTLNSALLHRCRARSTYKEALVIGFVSCSVLAIPFVFSDGRPFTTNCFEQAESRHVENFTANLFRLLIVLNVISTALIAWPCVWLFSVCNTPYMRRVSRYVLLLWFQNSVDSVYNLVLCIDVQSEYGFPMLVMASISYASTIIFRGRLILSRIEALEANLLRYLYSRHLKRAWIAMCAIGAILAILTTMPHHLPKSFHVEFWIPLIFILGIVCPLAVA